MCGTFTARYRATPEPTEKLFFGWAQRFMDGMNAASLIARGPRDISSMPLDDQKRFLRQYCEEYPKANFLAASWHCTASFL
jgi:hypothetical protein